MKKNSCQTIIIDENNCEQIVDKKIINTFQEADIIAKKHMSYDDVYECIVAYKCSDHYHVGRNGKILTTINKKKIKREVIVFNKKKELKRLKNFKPKIIGKIDLSLIKNK